MTDGKQFTVIDDRFSDGGSREQSRIGNNRYLQWAITVFCWDGLLPIVVLLGPQLIHLLLPNANHFVQFLSVVGPLVAYTIRFIVGWIRMRSGASYIWQAIVFFAAVSLLFVLETICLVDHFGPGPKIAGLLDIVRMYLIYFGMMAVAMFPLRRASAMR